MAAVEAGLHLPLIDFDGEGLSYRRLAETVDAARECRFAAISANDHFLFSATWLDGLTALAAVVERSGGMKLVTTLALATLRGPVPLAKSLSALDVLSGGRMIAGVGPGSSRADYDQVTVGRDQPDTWRSRPVQSRVGAIETSCRLCAWANIPWGPASEKQND
jgi:alkanesulfonate monooxygenase SsuD/methylene tetrahydromethanopterin reductase-like flavin-dependent oxidoreductase (luciferase family)